MAFATKYSIEGTSDIYGKVTVNLRQDLYAGSITYFEGAGRDWISLSIGQGGNDISLAILPSKCSVQFYAMTDFVAIELAQDAPFTWQMQVLDTDGDLIWQGIVLPEEYQENYINTPYIVSITASDGLEELKTIDYPITVGGKASLWDHLTDALAFTGQSIHFFESVNIYDIEMDTANGDSPFLQAEVTYETFLKLNDKPNCYDVVVAILKPFFARVYQYRGWRIENIYGKKASYIEREFDESGVYVTNTSVNPVVELDNDPSDFKAFLSKSGSLQFHPALNSTEIYFNTARIVNPNGPGGWSLESDWTNSTTLTDWTNENSISISKLAFGYNGSETIVRIQGKQDSLTTGKHIKSGAYTINSADFQNFFFRFDYWMNYPTLIILGSKPILYLQVELTDSLSNEWYYKNGSWTLIKDDGWIRIDAVGRQIWKPFEININTLPNITGSADIRFYVYQLVKSGSADQVELRLTNWATNIQIDEAYEDLILQEKAGLNILSTYKGPSFQHFISDGEVVDLAGVMDVNGVLTSEWNRRGETDALNIRRLFMMQWLTMHQGQAVKIGGTLYQKGEHVTPMSVIKDKDSVSTRKYIMTGWEFSLGRGTGSINFHEIFENEVTPFYLLDFVTSIPSSAYILPDYSIPIGVPGLSPGVLPGGGGISIPNISFPPLNGDVRGEPSGAEITPSAIFGKARLDTTGLTGTDIIFNAVKDTPTQENMTNLRLSDTYPILDTTFVPYTGAKSNTNLGEYGLTTGNLIFDTTPTNIPTAQGAMYWDADDETVALIMNGAIQKVGEDSFYQVKNQTGSNIAKGVAVRFAGTVGNSGRLLIAPFLADGTYPSTYFMGVTMEAIDNGEDGKVMWFGRIRGINTNAYNEGDILYASTTVAGGFQTTVPQAPNNIVEVCAVVTKSATVGTIFVRPTLGSNINRDEGVKITSPATGDLLQRQSNGLFENRSLATIGILTGSLTSGYIPRATGATTLTDSSIYETGTNVLIGSTTSSGEKLQVTGIGIFKTNLFSIDGADPIFRIRTNNNVSTVNFRNVLNEDNAGIEGNFNTNSFNIITRSNNMNIRIEPHGTGKIVLPNVPTGTGDVLGRDSSNNLVRLGGGVRFSQSALGYSKDLGTLADDPGGIDGFTWVSVFNNTNLTGSRNFTASTECSANSLYRITGKVIFEGDGSPVPYVNIRFNIFSQNYYTSSVLPLGTTTTVKNTYEFLAYLRFGNDGSNKFFLQYTFRRVFDGESEPYQIVVNDSGNISTAISGSSDLEIYAGGNKNCTGKVYEVICERIK